MSTRRRSPDEDPEEAGPEQHDGETDRVDRPDARVDDNVPDVDRDPNVEDENAAEDSEADQYIAGLDDYGRRLFEHLRSAVTRANAEAARRRHQMRDLKAELENDHDETWRSVAIAAEVRAQAIAAGLRPELALRLVDLEQVAGRTPQELQLTVEQLLAEASEQFPELRRAPNARPLVSQGARTEQSPRPRQRSWLRG